MRILSLIGIIAMVLSAASHAHADAYIYEDPSGRIILTDTPSNHRQIASIVPPENIKARGKKSSKSSGVVKGYTSGKKTKYFTRYNSIIKRAASKYKLDHKLVSAVVQVESQFKPDAVSRTGAIGLMQLMPSTARQLGVLDSYDPSQNIEGGTKYLRYLVERFKGDVTLALAAYNSGPLNVEKYGKVPPFKETKGYIRKIYSIYKGRKKIDLSARNDIIIRRVTLDNGSVVYSDYLQNGSPSF